MTVVGRSEETGIRTVEPGAISGVRRRRHYGWAFWSFVGPMAIGVVVFVVVPIVWGLVLSFGSAQTTITPTRFVGWANYAAVLSDPQFRRSLVLIAVFALFIVPLTLAFSLLLALLVNAVPRGRGVFRTIFFVPTACSYVVASAVWRMSLFNGLAGGFANTVLHWFGHAPIAWIGTATPPWYWLVLVTVRLWLQTGFYMIIFTAGLQEIPVELYEAARIDGVRNKAQELRHITLPLLRNTTVSVLLLCLIGNQEIVAINQDPMGEQAWVARDYGDTEVWARSLADGSKAVALLNRGSSTANITMQFADIYLGSEAGRVRNLLTHADAGVYGGGYTVSVASHDTVVFKVAPVAAQSIQFESGVLAGGARVQNCATCSGGKNVGYVGGGSGTATLAVTVPTAGLYSLSLYYNSAETRSVSMAVNGGTPVVISGLNSGAWIAVSSYTVFAQLAAGNNQLTFSNPSGWAPDLDRLLVAPD